MTVSFLPPELPRWDALGGAPEGPPEALVLPFFADERPLRGAAGTADWRLCGRLSRLVVGGRVAGTFGETTLLPSTRLPFSKVLLFGLGDSARFDEARFVTAAAGLVEVIHRLGVRRYAIALPGRSTGRIMAKRALELWLKADGDRGELWVIEAQAGQKEMAEVVGRRR